MGVPEQVTDLEAVEISPIERVARSRIPVGAHLLQAHVQVMVMEFVPRRKAPRNKAVRFTSRIVGAAVQ
jgi:hypothetical protein